MNNAGNDLKFLQTKISDLDIKIKDLEDQIKPLMGVLEALKAQRNNTFKAIIELKSKELVVSEHAMLRFLERKFKYNIKELSDYILHETVVKNTNLLGSGKFPHPDGFRVIIKDRVVTTVEF